MPLPELNLKNAVQVEDLIQKSHLVLSASAGTGKTFSLVTFALGFLGRGTSRPHDLMAMSYAKDAARDLKDKMLLPLEKAAWLSIADWDSLLRSLLVVNDSPEWTQWDNLSASKIGKEFAYAARQWRLSNVNRWPEWTTSSAMARDYWISIQREAQLIPITTIHSAAFAIMGRSERDVIECTHPQLIRCLKSVCRSVYSELPAGLGDEILAAYPKDKEWALVAETYDRFVDGQGIWRNDEEVKDLDSLTDKGKKIVESFNELVKTPGDLIPEKNQDGSDSKNFQRVIGKLKCQTPKQGRDLIRQIDGLMDLFLNENGELKDYFLENDSLEKFVENLQAYVDLLEQHVSQASEKAFKKFEEKKKDLHLTTYGDIIRGACEHLKSNQLSHPPQLLLVDEYQDANPAQELFLSLLRPGRQIIVGDTKQAIYGFRGGDSKLLQDKIEQAIENGSAYSLLTNYRSLPPIVQLSNDVVQKIFPKIINKYISNDNKVKAERSNTQDFTIGITQVNPQDNKKKGLIPQFYNPIGYFAHDGGWIKKGFGSETSANSKNSKSKRVLLLPRRGGAYKLIRELRNNYGIAAFLHTEEGRSNSPGIRIMNALLGFFAEPEEPRHLFVLLRSPWIGMTNQQLFQAAKLFKDKRLQHNLDRLDGLVGELPPELASFKVSIQWLASLKGYTTARILSEALTRQPGVLELINALRKPLGPLEVERAQRNLEAWLTSTQRLSDSPSVAYFQIQEIYKSKDKGDPPLDESSVDLIISTIHQSKGLEYESVILPLSRYQTKSLHKGSLNMKSLADDKRFSMVWTLGNLKGAQYSQGKAFNDQKQLESFANLFYVAITRPKDRLMFIQLSKKKNKKEIDDETKARRNQGKQNIEIDPYHLSESFDGINKEGVKSEVAETDWMVLGTELRKIEDQPFSVKILELPSPRPINKKPTDDNQQPSHPKKLSHPTDVEISLENTHHASFEVDQARREGLALHELVRELLLHPGEDKDREQWLTPYKDSPPYNVVISQAQACIKTLKDQNWLQFPRRTEYPLEGTAISLETGFADLVIWNPNRENPEEVIVIDYKRSIPEGQLGSYQQQVSRYMKRLRDLHVTSTIKGFLYDATKNELIEVACIE